MQVSVVLQRTVDRYFFFFSNNFFLFFLPCRQSGVKTNVEGFCEGSEAIYQECQACENDKECKQFAGGGKVVCSNPWTVHSGITDIELAGGEDPSKKDKSAGRKICTHLKEGGEACKRNDECMHGQCHTAKDMAGEKKKKNIKGEYQRLTGACSYPDHGQSLGSECFKSTECKDDDSTCDVTRMFDECPCKDDDSTCDSYLDKVIDRMNIEEIKSEFEKRQGYGSHSDPFFYPSSNDVQEWKNEFKRNMIMVATRRFGYVYRNKRGNVLNSIKEKRKRRRALRKAYVSILPTEFKSGVCVSKILAGTQTTPDLINAASISADGAGVEMKKEIPDVGRCANFDSKNQKESLEKDGRFVYTGIAYVDIQSASQNPDLIRASDENNPSFHSFAFRLPFSMKHIARSDFLMKPTSSGMDDSDMQFMQPVDDVCIALDEDGQIVVNEDIPVEYRHICNARAAYADVFVQFRQAYDSEMVLRDPCRIDPTIDAHEYVKKESPFVFFGWPLGKHT